MMAKFSYIDDCIKIGEGIFPVLVIENKKLYRGVMSSFLNSCEEDYFVFSEDFKPFEFSKDGYRFQYLMKLHYSQTSNKLRHYNAQGNNIRYIYYTI